MADDKTPPFVTVPTPQQATMPSIATPPLNKNPSLRERAEIDNAKKAMELRSPFNPNKGGPSR